MKQLVEKTEDTSRHIQTLRRSVSFGVGDKDKIASWEAANLAKGTPMSKFHESWSKARTKERAAAAKEEVDKEYDFVPKMKKKLKREGEDDQEFDGLLPDGDDSDDMVRGHLIFSSLTSLIFNSISGRRRAIHTQGGERQEEEEVGGRRGEGGSLQQRQEEKENRREGDGRGVRGRRR